MSEKEKVATPLFYLLRLMLETIAYAKPTARPKVSGIHTGKAAGSIACLNSTLNISNMPDG